MESIIYQYDNQKLKGKVAIVTGAGSRGTGTGNGCATAIELAKQGAKVVIVDISREAALRTANQIKEEINEDVKNESFLIVEADVANPSDCKRIVDEAIKNFGSVDILVNNVGILGPTGTAEEVDIDQWDLAMQINVKSVMLMSKFCIPIFRKQGKGAIINVTSTVGLEGGSPYLFYPTSKGTLVNMTKVMAAHHGPEGIRVNAVAPGLVITPMVGGENMSHEKREFRKNQTLLKTEGTAWDVAKAIAFLASDDARWITGVILPVDGGLTAGNVRVFHETNQVKLKVTE